MSGRRGWRELDALELEVLLEEAHRPPPGPEPEEAGRKDTDRHGERPAEWRREPPKRELFGLALSGGGIRSATFNLGLLQELEKLGVLEHFHYLCTVSGGGYVGGFWSAWRQRSKQHGVFPGCEPTREGPEPPVVRHLREFSNFLRPRATLLGVETARIVSSLVGGVIPCLMVALGVLVIALGLWVLLVWLAAGEAPGGWLGVPGLFPALFMTGLTAAVAIYLERLWWRRGEELEAQARPWYRFWTTLAAGLTGSLAFAVWHVAMPPRLLLLPLPLDRLGTTASAAFLPALPWLVTTASLVFVRSLVSRSTGASHAGRARQAALDRMLARLVLCAAVWAVAGAVWLVGQLLASVGIGGLLGAVGTGTTAGGLFAWLRRLLFGQVNQPAAGSTRRRLGTLAFQALAYLTLAAAAAGAASLLVLIYRSGGPLGLGLLLLLAAGSVLASLVFDPHEIGLHGFYRNRLLRAYLGASNRQAPRGATAPCRRDDVPLTWLESRPLHLVCCAANDLTGDPLGTLHRGADSAVLSKLGFQVGNHWGPWERDEATPPLASVLTASGAAFNSHMGAVSVRLGRAVTFLLTALGLRLGLWLENPARGRPGDRRAPGHLLLRELFGNSRSDARWLHLSDGAHFENLALYELVRRHCRFILLSDCGTDPDRAFDDFGNAVRRVREDFGVEIDIDITPLQPDENTKRSRQPMVAGDILYPPAEPGGERDAGILLYIKPTLTGDEPSDVAQYAGRNDRFPHETTLDQFYDEAQWESYRRLGGHAIASAFSPVEDWLRGPTERTADAGVRPESAFLRARYFWPPLPDEEPAIDAYEAAWTKLELELDRAELEPLRDEIAMYRSSTGVAANGNEEGPSQEVMVAALPAVREAVRLMEGLYLRTGFGHSPRSPSHERYMGWLNRLGAWASAPIFRAWWPWLAPFHAGKFNSFMDHTFGLKTDPFRAGAVLELDADGTETGAYAYDRWRAASGEASGKPPADTLCVGYFVDLGKGLPELNAAILRFRTRRAGERWSAVWSFDDFYVAPGLWGMGIGEAFLAALVGERPPAGPNDGRGYLESEHGCASAVVTSGNGSGAANDALYAGARFAREGGHFVRALGESG